LLERAYKIKVLRKAPIKKNSAER